MSHSSHARLAGALYLVPMFLGPFSMMYVPSVVLVAGDAAATSAHLAASEGLFRLGLASDAAIFLVEVALTAVLYALMRPVGRTLALTSTFARLGMTVLQAVNLLPHLVALKLATSGGEATQVSALLDAHGSMVHLWELFFALHCLTLGVLVFRCGFLPRALGPLVALAGLGYGANGLGHLVAPGAAAVLAGVVGLTAVVGEVPLVLWLVFKGVDEARWRTSAAALSAQGTAP